MPVASLRMWTMEDANKNQWSSDEGRLVGLYKGRITTQDYNLSYYKDLFLCIGVD